MLSVLLPGTAALVDWPLLASYFAFRLSSCVWLLGRLGLTAVPPPQAAIPITQSTAQSLFLMFIADPFLSSRLHSNAPSQVGVH
ncbi:MAG: hypothetical protein EBT05_05490 [Betaproteobacteria bacterium]|nr:hypothetical protein [Betaproteobacteria bacterium]